MEQQRPSLSKPQCDACRRNFWFDQLSYERDITGKEVMWCADCKLTLCVNESDRQNYARHIGVKVNV